MAIYPGNQYFQKECDGIVIPGNYFVCKIYPVQIELSVSSCAERYQLTQRQANQIDAGHP